MQKVILLLQSHLLDGPQFRMSGRRSEMNQRYHSFRQILKIIKLVMEIIVLIIKIIRDIYNF